MKAIGIILAGGNNNRMKELTAKRAQCAVQQPFLCGDDSIRFGTELRGRSVLFLQKRDCFWQNREFSTNKLVLLTIYNREHHDYTYVRLISCLYI